MNIGIKESFNHKPLRHQRNVPGVNEMPLATQITESEESFREERVQKDMFVESFKEKILTFRKDRSSSYLKREQAPVEFKDPSLEPVPEAFSCKKYFNTYVFMLWDGLGFFGFDDAKLDRIRRKPASVFDKCNSVQRMVIIILGLTVLIYVLVTQVAKWGM